jgi:hypothetical protein
MKELTVIILFRYLGWIIIIITITIWGASCCCKSWNLSPIFIVDIRLVRGKSTKELAITKTQ